ncbi:hypothetical protein GGI21_004569 [Coemansia aciculifera]|uniref:Uncharacterized protein n=1 Tax=Coemansia aciculifera TaxID=417176 RepID=A0ACC1M8S6_9FUNG|nr:hypothetical protein IWW38_000438 [Coemansia aciculifera]KAJ2902333.1 hypothetical protein GGI21_004569 [Coemansia aciculifera]
MIVGVGVDILCISRIEAIVQRGSRFTARFARRILSDSENDYFGKTVAAQEEAQQVKYLATRWCLKEAIYKAAYPRQTLRWRDVTVFKAGHKPAMNVRWSSELEKAQAHISLSHDGGLLAGFVVVEM